ncbi:MAG: DUF2062 domain-containing protein [Desulforhopalus sp.]
MNLWRYIKYYYIKFKRLQGSPHALAGGTAIGVFIGLTPTMPFHTILIIFLSILTRTSALAGIIVSWIVCNPLTYLPIYYFSVVVGNHLTPYELNLGNVRIAMEQALAGDGIQNSLTVLVASGYEALVVMAVGGFSLALPFAVASYYPAFYFFMQIKKKRIKKHVLD